MAEKAKRKFKLNFNLFTTDLGVDLGTANVLIYSEGRGVLVR